MLARDVRLIFDEANHSDRWRWIDHAGGALVVEADVAAGDRRVKRAASLGEAFDALAQLPEIFRFVRIAEIEIVGHRHWPRTAADKIPGRLGDRHHGALTRLNPAEDRVAIGGGGEKLIGLAH